MIKQKIVHSLHKFVEKSSFSVRLRTDLAQLNKFLDSYSKIKSRNKFKTLMEFERKFPMYPKIHFIKAMENFKDGKWEFKENLDQYAKLREEWILDNNLSALNSEFLWPGLYLGAFGNHNQIFSLLRAKRYGYRKRNLVGFYKSNQEFTNKSLMQYFMNEIELIKIDQYPTELFYQDLMVPNTFITQMDNLAPYQTFGVNLLNQTELERNFESVFTLTDEHNNNGIKFLSKFGFQESNGDWFVTLHLREPTFRHETINNTTENFRNVSLQSYELAIEKIIEAGGWVVRVGDSRMTPMASRKNFIDYATSDTKSPELDIYFGAKCAFAITTSSGYRAVPTIFGKPQLQTNFLPGTHVYEGSTDDVFILRDLIDKQSNSVIQIADHINNPFYDLTKDSEYKAHNLIWRENSPEHLLEGTKYMISKYINKIEPHIRFTALDNNKLNTEINAIHKYKPVLISTVLKNR